MTNDQMIRIITATVSFVTVILAGAVVMGAAGAWLRNRREERENRLRTTQIRMDELYERERVQWTELIREKDGQIAALNNEVLRLSRNYDIVSQVLKAAERKNDE